MPKHPRPPVPPPAQPAPAEHRPVRLAGALLAVLAAAAYANTFAVPLLLDDRSAITENPSIQSFWRLGRILQPPDLSSAGGRPVLNLSLALNYAISGQAVWSYHALNLLIHILAGLTLFGVVRRSLNKVRGTGFQPVLGTGHGLEAHATCLAFAVAAIWMLHPLQTEAVTYISQRAESLMGLFYLLTLYGFIRDADESESENRKAKRGNAIQNRAAKFSLSAFRFSLLSVSACFLGMGTKEVMVTAPALVLLYDRAFVSRSVGEALGRRPWYYCALGASWIPLGCLMAGSNLAHRLSGVSGSVGGAQYACTELKVVTDYLALAIWPHPLVFDYGSEMQATGFGSVAPYALVILAAVAATVVAWRRSKPLGFAAVSFFLLLTPTSSFVPLPLQPMAESRMYLPLASVVTLAALGAYAAGPRPAFIALAIAGVALGVATFRRNLDYRSTVSIWEDTVAKRPESSRGQYSLGVMLGDIPGRLPEAIDHYEAAVRINPDYAEAHGNLAIALAQTPGREAEALPHFETSLRLDPSLATIHFSYGATLEKAGRARDAIGQYQQALQLRPDYLEAENNLANLLVAIPGRESEGLACYEQALRDHPESAQVRSNLAHAHCNLADRLIPIPGRAAEAMAHYEAAVQLEPGFVAAHFNLGSLYANSGRFADAIAQWETVLQLNPGDAQATHDIAVVQAMQKGRP